MIEFELWLERASRGLSQESRATVRAEIADHFASSLEELTASGIEPENAEREALRSLGSAAAANRLYRKSLLTEAEAETLQRLVRRSEPRNHPAMRVVLTVMPVLIVAAGIAFHQLPFASILAVYFAVLLTAPYYPIYTVRRARIYRAVRWAIMAGNLGVLGVLLGWRLSWSVVFFPLPWIDLRCLSIRRKLPIDRWPKQLYLQ